MTRTMQQNFFWVALSLATVILCLGSAGRAGGKQLRMGVREFVD